MKAVRSPIDYVTGPEEERARRSIEAYSEHYTGRHFETFAAESPTDAFAATDVVAVEMLSVRVPAKTSLWLLRDGSDLVSEQLRQVEAGTPLWSDDLDLSPGGPLWKLWDAIRLEGGLGGNVVRSKLLAAKRPHAVPIYDQHVAAALGAPASAYWSYWRAQLGGQEGQRLRDTTTRVAADAGRPELTVLRTLDIVIWMRQHGWRDMSALLPDYAQPLVEDDEETAEEFRDALKSFVRTYAFLAQVVPYSDEDLEKLYLFGKILLPRLPAKKEPSLDLGDEVELTHLRTETTGTHDLSLGKGDGDQLLPGFGGEGRGPITEARREALRTIVERLNDRFGTTLSESDQLSFDQMVVAATEVGDLAEAANANDQSNFGLVFDDKFEGIVIDRHDANTTILKRFLDDGDFAEMLTRWAREEAYRRLREEGA